MTVTTAAVPDQGPEDLEPPFSPQLVAEMLRQLDKTIRAHLLYLNNHNNPSYVRSLEQARAVFAPMWEETDAVRLSVTDTALEWFGQKVFEEPTKASDSLPWTLFKDGLRELTLLKGFEETELVDFLDIIPKVRHALPTTDDLLTLLWENEFTKLQYRYVDVSDESAPIEASPEPGRWPKMGGGVSADPSEAVQEAKDEEAAAGSSGGGSSEKQGRSGIVSMEDFDTTLYFLDDKEVEYLRQETLREYATDLRRAVLDSLLDIFEFQPDPLVRAEVLSDIEALMLHLLSAGQFAAVAYLLREAAATLDRARDVQPETKERLASLSVRLSEPAALAQLLEAMDAAPALPSSTDLNDLFSQLRPTALATIFAWLPRAQNVGLRPLLESAATRIAEAATGELVKLIADPSRDVALEAIRRCGAMRTAAGVPAMAKVIEHGDREFRLAALSALGDIGSPGALQAMERALSDADRDLRVQAARTLMSRQYRPALQRAEAAVKSKELRDADRTERLTFFELYGSLCGEAGVPYLDSLLNAKGGLFARKEDPELRACAAVALGRIGTAAARESLQRADGDKEIVVRNAVTRAMRGGGTQ